MRNYTNHHARVRNILRNAPAVQEYKADYKYAAYAAILALVGSVMATGIDIWWAFQDFNEAPDHRYLIVVICGLTSALTVSVISILYIILGIRAHTRDQAAKKAYYDSLRK